MKKRMNFCSSFGSTAVNFLLLVSYIGKVSHLFQCSSFTLDNMDHNFVNLIQFMEANSIHIC